MNTSEAPNGLIIDNVPAASASLPQPQALEQNAAALAGAPDPALIARMANAFFGAAPANPVTTPGAAFPSAPLFAAEPLYSSIPGTPNATPPLTPNNNPGSSVLPLPSSGGAGPSAPLYAAAPKYQPGNPLPAAADADVPFERSFSPSAATPGAAPSPALSVSPAEANHFTRETDYARLPSRLEGLSFVPRLDAPAHPFGGPGAAPYSLQASTPLHFVRENPAYTAPREAVIPTTPFFDVQTLDLSRLTAQHQPDIPAQHASGTRAFDPHVFRRDFPILDQHVNGRPLIWLDNGATTQKPQSVIDRLARFYSYENSNIHRAAHTLAARSTDAYEAAREKVRAFINAPSVNDIIFVRGATEGVNLVAQAWGRRNIGKDDEIVVSHLEHHANIVPWQQLCLEKGAKLRVAPVDDSGQIILDEYEKLFNSRTKIAAFTQVSNALGTITPAQEMAAIAHRHGARVLIDGAQGICHMPVDVQALDADFYVFSGHKMFGPTGIGVVYGRGSELEAMPPWQGGGNMIADVTFEKTVFQGPPNRFEAGTGNIADAVGLGAAIDYLNRIGMSNVAAYEHELLAYAMQGLKSVPGLRLIGTAREKAGVHSFVLDECKTEDVGKALDREGIAVRAGHHCAQPILRRFGLESTVRPSFALYNTTDDVDALVSALLRIQSSRGYRNTRE